MSRPTIDETMMAVALAMSRRGTCLLRGVGCVLADSRGRILSAGYNGRPSGMPHCNEEATRAAGYRVDRKMPAKLNQRVEVPTAMVKVRPHACNGGKPFPPGSSLCEAVHAEQNALLQCRDPDAIATVYVTIQPCMSCAKTLLNTGARRLVYGEPYDREPQALELWESAGREASLLPAAAVRPIFFGG